MSQPDHNDLPATAPIDGLDVERLDSLRDLDPGDTTYLDRAIANFQVNSAAAVDAVREAAEAGDVATVKARSHKIAGSALNLGVPRAGEAARAVEIAADSGSVEPALPLLDEFEAAMAEGRELLLTYQATYAG
ncbi:Hpt domain-containing protein [Nocardioides sp.]|uniref:Hpt domain-containing protein n=1 Tax=Nocardioides sp. TaxID=35761 RepID=UPI002715ACE6|nr:Hpt domain-containing protein [Nocardioides sp.]MDO9454870.1 Hpt domain-containing protein [Nocardioides sp.]